MKRILSHYSSHPYSFRLASRRPAAIFLFALLAIFPVAVDGQAVRPSGSGKPPAPAAMGAPLADKSTGVQKTPAAPQTTAAAPTDASIAGAVAPAVGKEAPAATLPTTGDVVKVQLPDGQYLVWITQGTQSSVQSLVQTRSPVILTCPGAGAVKLWVIDPTSDKLAVVDTSPNRTVSVTNSNFNEAARVTVRLEDKDNKPLDFATVTLTAGDLTQVQQLTPMDGGVLRFSGIPLGMVNVTAVRPDAQLSTGTDISKNENSPIGSDASSIELPIKMAAASTLPVASRNQTTDGTEGSGVGPLGSMASNTGNGRLSSGSTASGSTRAAVPKPGSQPTQPTGSRALYLVAILLLAVLAVAGIWGARNPERLRSIAGPWLDRLGLQFPGGDEPIPSAHTTDSSPPLALRSSTCAFCGTHKDPVTGSCACTLVPASVKAAGGSALSATTPLTADSVAGPRFITLDGPVTGQVFSVAAESSIGRDTTNTIALAEDTAVSRRHARVSPNAGQIEIIDEGSSNGTFVNGARVDRQVLRPTDEILIGHSLFRFEV